MHGVCMTPHRPDITLELKITQIRKKIFAENIFAAQVLNVRIRKSEVLVKDMNFIRS